MAVIQNRTFRLAEGTDEAAFIAADARFQTEVAYHRPGMMRRTLARGDDGEWLVVTIWETAADADAGVPPSEELLGMIDRPSVLVHRYETLAG
jgi:heme-degrading monooxygenase HmoA